MTPLTHPAWLPAHLLKCDFPDTNALERFAYEIFKRDWEGNGSFHGMELRVHRHPHKANPQRWHTYWHSVTEGEREESRNKPIPDLLERVPWCRPILENDKDPLAGIKFWANVRGRDQHICIWFVCVNYLIVLKQCFNHYLLKTTYCPENRRRQQLHREYTAWKQTSRVV